MTSLKEIIRTFSFSFSRYSTTRRSHQEVTVAISYQLTIEAVLDNFVKNTFYNCASRRFTRA